MPASQASYVETWISLFPSSAAAASAIDMHRPRPLQSLGHDIRSQARPTNPSRQTQSPVSLHQIVPDQYPYDVAVLGFCFPELRVFFLCAWKMDVMHGIPSYRRSRDGYRSVSFLGGHESTISRHFVSLNHHKNVYAGRGRSIPRELTLSTTVGCVVEYRARFDLRFQAPDRLKHIRSMLISCCVQGTMDAD